MNKIIVMAFLPLFALATVASAEITTRVSEADRSGDGEIDVRFKTTYRDGERILGEMLRDGKNTRIFYAVNLRSKCTSNLRMKVHQQFADESAPFWGCRTSSQWNNKKR